MKIAIDYIDLIYKSVHAMKSKCGKNNQQYYPKNIRCCIRNLPNH